MKNSPLLHSLFLGGVLLASAPRTAAQAAGVYNIDPAHSGVEFKAKHFFSNVPGKFTDFTGNVTVAADPSQNSCSAVIQAQSINTGSDQRDGHLRDSDFFNTDAFPVITFQSTAWKKTGDNMFDVTGNLTMLKISKPVTLKVTFLGSGPGMRPGQTLASWTGTASINRSDWGISADAPIIGNQVAITIDVEADKSD
jgi:polyisoprenoid-binding protein YceI